MSERRGVPFDPLTLPFPFEEAVLDTALNPPFGSCIIKSSLSIDETVDALPRTARTL